MTDTRDWADEKATSIVDVWYAVHVPPSADVRFSPLIDAIALALRAARRDGWEVARRFEAELHKHIPITEARDPLCPEIMVQQAVAAARRVPDGHIREGDVDRKVLGTLLVTADGCVVGWGDFGMWYLRGNSREVVGPLLVKNDAFGFSGCQQHHSPSDCYSTRAAAEAARGGE